MSGSNNQSPDQSPRGLTGATRPPRRGQNVRRVNRVPLIIALAVAAIFLFAVVWTVHKKSELATGGGSQNGSVTASQVPEKTFVMPRPKPIAPPPQQADNGSPPTPNGPPGGPVQPAPNPYQAQWVRYESEVAQLDADRYDALRAALGDETSGNGTKNGVGGNSYAQQTAGSSAGTGTNSATSDYLSNGRTAAIARYEVKEGTVIPASLITGVNSDVAGQIIGQVREAVYDSATGDKILIPQGSKLIGTYSSHINYGQDRVQVSWSRIIFPDQSSIDLPAMPGADQTGESGFEDQVNNHLIKIFSAALLTSAFGAATQLSQPTNSSGDGYNSQQIVSAQLGLQLGEVGQEFARRGLDIPPTITIRPGYEFDVMVTKDMILPAYTDVYGNGEPHQVTATR